MRRARALFDTLRRAHPAMPRIFRVAQLGSSSGPLVLGAGLSIGLLLNALDPRPEIHILYVPFLAVLGWNLLFLAILPLLVLARGSAGRGPTRSIAGWLFRGAVRRRLRAARLTEDRGSPEAAIVHKALSEYMEALGLHLERAIEQLDQRGAIARPALAGAELGGNPHFIDLERP